MSDDKVLEAQSKSEGKEGPRKVNGQVVGSPRVRRNVDGSVTSATMTMKVPFVGTVEARLKGDLASAYWSLTDGMRVTGEATEVEKGVFEFTTMDIRPAD